MPGYDPELKYSNFVPSEAAVKIFEILKQSMRFTREQAHLVWFFTPLTYKRFWSYVYKNFNIFLSILS